MASSSDEEIEYEYTYSDDEDYSIDDDEDMEEWETDEKDNPNAAPMDCRYNKTKVLISNTKSGICMMHADELIPVMKQRLNEVTEVLDIPPSAAAILLRAHNWSKESLMEKFVNDEEKILRKCGVYARCTKFRLNKGENPNRPVEEKTCPVCYEDRQLFAMPCGHEICSEDCWYSFCEVKIKEGPVCVQSTCPHAGCLEIVTEDEFTKALSTRAPQLLSRYLFFQLRSFVDSNSLTRWCPGKGCEKIACATSTSAMEQDNNVANCDSCHLSFCIVCGEESHAPSSCKELMQWNEKCRNESETANWILANTKSCPKCVSRIEKNQGCNHMVCQQCKHEFCWICTGDWSDHGANTGGYYKCNKYDPKLGNGGNPDDHSDAAKAKQELDRYLHYYKRYHAHSEAQDFARKQLKETESRMILLQESSNDAKWSDVEFLKTANEQLVECRRVLKYTYVFAYYLLANGRQEMQKERFEHHQEMLERFTENLSELSEKPLSEMNRTNVVNQTRVVDRFVKNILKYVEDGLDDV